MLAGQQHRLHFIIYTRPQDLMLQMLVLVLLPVVKQVLLQAFPLVLLQVLWHLAAPAVRARQSEAVPLHLWLPS